MQVLLYIAPLGLERTRRFRTSRRRGWHALVAVALAQRRHFHSHRRAHLIRFGQIVADGPHAVHVADDLPGSWLFPTLGDLARSSRLDQLALEADPLQTRNVVYDTFRLTRRHVRDVIPRGTEFPTVLDLLGALRETFALRGVRRIAHVIVPVVHVRLLPLRTTIARVNGAARVREIPIVSQIRLKNLISRDDFRSVDQRSVTIACGNLFRLFLIVRHRHQFQIVCRFRGTVIRLPKRFFLNCN